MQLRKRTTRAFCVQNWLKTIWRKLDVSPRQWKENDLSVAWVIEPDFQKNRARFLEVLRTPRTCFIHCCHCTLGIYERISPHSESLYHLAYSRIVLARNPIWYTWKSVCKQSFAQLGPMNAAVLIVLRLTFYTLKIKDWEIKFQKFMDYSDLCKVTIY